MLCDFCHDPQPCWFFEVPAGFQPHLTTPNGVQVVGIKNDRWNACTLCASYVEHKYVPALVSRVAAALHAAGHVSAQTRQGRAELCDLLAQHYEKLFDFALTKKPLDAPES